MPGFIQTKSHPKAECPWPIHGTVVGKGRVACCGARSMARSPSASAGQHGAAGRALAAARVFVGVGVGGQHGAAGRVLAAARVFVGVFVGGSSAAGRALAAACVFVFVGAGGSTARARALGRSGGAVARERPNPNTHHMQIIIQNRPLFI